MLRIVTRPADSAARHTDVWMAVAHLATERWMADEHADFVRELLSAGAAEFPAVAAGAFAAGHPRP
ncbi:hypothetical protein [Streptomyces sp. WM6378]|uniref:hypothetical protein n=1 Tax=Streptomyces sp. WM6378 TaxID=1415557 RepID=UPI00131EAA93|nr:hypothetical protein [Streptomyces sp. WM6378]